MNSTPKPELRLDWCSHEAARYACEKWHYSRCIPAGKLSHLGVWENATFVGSVLFGCGANRCAGMPYALASIEVAELVRVALTKHLSPVSRIMAIAIRLLAKQSPGLRLLFSYADPAEGHHGGIYQAGGWLYVGRTKGNHHTVLPGGEVVHNRTLYSRYGHSDAGKLGGQVVYSIPKHKYLLPLDGEMKKKVLPLALPYPKRATSVVSDAPANHAGEGGATPTVALSSTPRLP